MRKQTEQLLSILFCLQAASDFDFVSIRLFLVAAICMICLVETLEGRLVRPGDLLLSISW